MNDLLKENRNHGTPSFPFTYYRMNEETSRLIISAHWHGEMEIIYIKSGTLYLTINNIKYSGTAGDIFIINGEELHEMYVQEIPTLYYAFVFSAGQLSFEHTDYVEGTYIQPMIQKKILFENKIICNASIQSSLEDLLNQIIKINTEESVAFQLGTKALLLQIFYLLIHHDMVKKNLHTLEKVEKLQQQKEIIRYIRSNFNQRLTLTEISAQFGMTPKYFCKYFKQHFSKTFVEYVNYVRMEYAMELLTSTDYSITEISSLSGFENFSYFIRKFRSIAGSTPSKYRKAEFTQG